MTGRMFALLCLTLVGGCAPTTGVVTGSLGSTNGGLAPDIGYVSAEGTPAKLSDVRHGTAVLCFVSAPGGSCCWLCPKTVQLADQLWEQPVSVVQILRPNPKCEHGKDCLLGCNLRNNGLISLCDGEWHAWRTYGQPDDGTLFLIVSDGKILMRGNLSDPASIVKEARRLGQAERERNAVNIDLY